MHMKHRNELPPGCNISLLFKRKLDTTLSSYAPINQLLSDYSPCLVEALLMGKENRATDGAFRRFRQA